MRRVVARRWRIGKKRETLMSAGKFGQLRNPQDFFLNQCTGN
jgi:hypothetical protein